VITKLDSLNEATFSRVERKSIARGRIVKILYNNVVPIPVLVEQDVITTSIERVSSEDWWLTEPDGVEDIVVYWKAEDQ
jgi:hypothetical protein